MEGCNAIKAWFSPLVFALTDLSFFHVMSYDLNAKTVFSFQLYKILLYRLI